MTFDQNIIVWCVVVPSLIAAAAMFVASRVAPPYRNITVAVGWWIAMVAAMISRQGWQWWPGDAWRQTIWPILAWAVLVAATAPRDEGKQPFTESFRWVLAGLLACLTALVAIPSGDQWSDTFHLHRIWMCAVATSCLVNSYAVQSMAQRGARRWCLLVALASLGGPMALAASSYGSLAEWTVAIVVASLVAAVIGILVKSIDVWVIAFPIFAAAASITASGRFYTYAENPAWVYLVMLYGTALVAIVDWAVGDRPTWLRVTASGLVSLALVGACVWCVLLR